MRRHKVWIVLAMAGLFGLAAGGGSNEAQAFGDKCFKPLKVTGDWSPSHRSAMASARGAWEAEVEARHGGRFANWYYSGDRTMDCKWDASGESFICATTATPCGRKR